MRAKYIIGTTGTANCNGLILQSMCRMRSMRSIKGAREGGAAMLNNCRFRQLRLSSAAAFIHEIKIKMCMNIF